MREHAYTGESLVCTLGGYKEPNSHRWGPGIRNIFAMHYIISGSGTLETRGKAHRVSSGESFMIFPHQEVYYYPDPEDPWEYVWIEFKGDAARRLVGMTSLTPDLPVTGKSDHNLQPLFDIMEPGNGLPHHKLRSAARLQLLWSYYAEAFPHAALVRQTDYVWEAKEYIHNNYWRTGLSVSEIVRFVAIERSYLFRLFREATGMSVSAYLASYRMQRACELLEMGTLSVQSVAYSVGYQDPLYFSKVFKKATSHTPTAYRMQHRVDAALTE
ncbi:AraC family transcriptional regulator [Paenibacillus daejeonensis]|uniref:AraC family transcriptional regulator n=1 Tax=Paenibacillus daejeonensis TaxID=135193 RepID=UPI000371967A|nr:AraC family transcriptional regulator [Paenibacillus daejeonensis]